MAYTIKALRSNGNSVYDTTESLWYKGSGGLKDISVDAGGTLDDSDTSSGWTNLYAERKTYDSKPSDSDVNTIQGYLPSDNKTLFPDSGSNSGTTLNASVVTE